MRVRAGLWLVGVSILAAILALQIHSGSFNLQSNLLALLPAPQRDEVTTAAFERLGEVGEKRLILIFSALEVEQQQRAAQAAAEILSGSDAFSQVALRIDDWMSETQRRELQHLLSYYRFQLLEPNDRAALADSASGQDNSAGLERFVERARARIYGIGLGDVGRFIDDPFGLVTAYRNSIIANPAISGLRVATDGSFYAQSTDGERHSVMFIQSTQDPFSLSAQELQIQVLDRALAQARSASPGIKIQVSGVLPHADAASLSARNEVTLIGMGSLTGIVLLMLWVFHSVRPILLSVLVVAGGCLLAVVTTSAVFGNIHVLTLVFGTSLVGVAIDYCIHFFVQRSLSPQPMSALREIFPAITLGLLSSVLAYGSLALAPFPGLRQMAVFSAVGLIGAWLGVMLLLPAFAGSGPVRGMPLHLVRRGLAKGVFIFGGRGKNALVGGLGIVFCVAVSIAVIWLTPNDDIRLLYSSSPKLVADEHAIAELLGGDTNLRALVVRGATAQDVLRNEAAVIEDLRVAKPTIAAWSALSDIYPLPAIQQQDYRLLQSTLYAEDGPLQGLLKQLGFSETAISNHRNEFIQAQGRELTFPEWLASPFAYGREFLWLGRIGEQWASLIMLHDIQDTQRLENVLNDHDNVLLLDRVAMISGLLHDYRSLATLLLVVIYGLVWLLLYFPFGWRSAATIVLPPILASVLVAAIFALTGWTFSLFNLFALILLLGIGADYGIFLQTGGAKRDSAMLAVILSAATTLLAFGLLAFSQTPALHSFGLTLAIGIFLTFLLASLLSIARETEHVKPSM